MMLGRQGIISAPEAEKIVTALGEILADIEDGKIEFSVDNEDIHMNIERLLIQRIGETGKGFIPRAAVTTRLPSICA